MKLQTKTVVQALKKIRADQKSHVQKDSLSSVTVHAALCAPKVYLQGVGGHPKAEGDTQTSGEETGDLSFLFNIP